MAKSARKFAALFLTLALSFSFSIPTLAAETHDHDCEEVVVYEGNAIGASVSPLSACQSHTWQSTTTSIVVPYAGEYISATTCRSYWREIRTCSKCKLQEIVQYYYLKNDTHHTIVYSASCNGTTQTWLNKCNQCGHSMPTTTKRCPGAPHSGGCNLLPV